MFIFGGDVVVAAIVVVKVDVMFRSAIGSNTIVVVAADVDCRHFVVDGVAVVVKDDVEWNSFLLEEDGTAVVPGTAIRFVFLFL